jgi:hypothetical protein
VRLAGAAHAQGHDAAAGVPLGKRHVSGGGGVAGTPSCGRSLGLRQHARMRPYERVHLHVQMLACAEASALSHARLRRSPLHPPPG